MSARKLLVAMGGSSEVSQRALSLTNPRYKTVIWKRRPRKRGFPGGLSSVAMQAPKKFPESLRWKMSSAMCVSRPMSRIKVCLANLYLVTPSSSRTSEAWLFSERSCWPPFCRASTTWVASRSV